MPHRTPKHSGASTTVAMVVMVVHGFLSPASAGAAPPQIPALSRAERLDWINVKTGIAPAAVGDGQADDTLALQKALTGLRDGSVLYFPAGVYRITAPLWLRNPTGARWIGGLMVGSGRDTKLVWDGGAGGTMLLLNGIACSRFVGFELDGRGKAGVGFRYQATQGFQTEVTHRHLAFRGFTNAAVLEDHPNEGQRLLVSGNQVHGASGLIQGARPMLMTVPPGERKGVIRSASQSVLKGTAHLPKRVFDPQLSPAASLLAVGNEFYGSALAKYAA